MANVQMACPLYHGRAESCLSGMSCVPTLLHRRIPPSQVPNQVPLLPKRRRGSAQSTVTSDPTIIIFNPISIEISGSMGPKTRDFLKKLGYRLRLVSGEINSSSYIPPSASIHSSSAWKHGFCHVIYCHSADMDFFV